MGWEGSKKVSGEMVRNEVGRANWRNRSALSQEDCTGLNRSLTDQDFAAVIEIESTLSPTEETTAVFFRKYRKSKDRPKWADQPHLTKKKRSVTITSFFSFFIKAIFDNIVEKQTVINK